MHLLCQEEHSILVCHDNHYKLNRIITLLDIEALYPLLPYCPRIIDFVKTISYVFHSHPPNSVLFLILMFSKARLKDTEHCTNPP